MPEWSITLEKVNENKLVSFLNSVERGYHKKVTYHNDLHAADVTQMMFYILNDGGNLIQIAELNHIDTLACLIAAACHDFGHDGFTNAFHVTAMTERSIRYNDVSVQESYHASESFRLLLEP